jgi:hypothetical protein
MIFSLLIIFEDENVFCKSLSMICTSPSGLFWDVIVVVNNSCKGSRILAEDEEPALFVEGDMGSSKTKIKS